MSNYTKLTETFPVGALVTVTGQPANFPHGFPGTYRVAQPVDLDGWLHLSPVDDIARKTVPLSLIVHADHVTPTAIPSGMRAVIEHHNGSVVRETIDDDYVCVALQFPAREDATHYGYAMRTANPDVVCLPLDRNQCGIAFPYVAPGDYATFERELAEETSADDYWQSGGPFPR